MPEPIGAMFPTGGPVPAELIIGRGAELTEIGLRITQGVHLLITGPRRIGKTTVCRAACAAAQRDGALIIPIEVPERVDSRDLLQSIIDRVAGLSLRDDGRKVVRALRPVIDRLLGEAEIPLDLSELGREPATATSRAVMALPGALAAETGARVVLFLDELQRIVDYADGQAILSDLLDLYGGQAAVTVIADGSDDRTVEGLLGDPGHIGKLCEPYALPPTIGVDVWGEPLRQRFAAVELTVQPQSLQELLDFGAGRPYETMLACRHAAMTARRMSPDGNADIGILETHEGIARATKQLRADGA